MRKELRAVKQKFWDEELNAMTICYYILRKLNGYQVKRVLKYLVHRLVNVDINWK